MSTSKQTTLIGACTAVAFIMLFSMLGSASACQTNPYSFTTVTAQSQNAYKWPSVTSTMDSSLYSEWWYFEVNDGATMNMTVWYEFDNPANVTNDYSIPSQAYTGMEGFIGNAAVADPFYTPAPFSASSTSLSVQIGSSTISGYGLDLIHLQGVDASIGGSWNLWFVRDGVPGMQSPAVQAGYYPTDAMGWCSYMPKATVFGTISLAGQTIAICGALGYSDHDWGSPTTIAYAPWTKIVQSNILMTGGATLSATEQATSSACFWNVYYDGKWIYFSPVVTYTWAIDADGVPFISGFHIAGTSGNYKVNVDIVYCGAQQFSALINYGAYSIYFLKSFGFHATGTFKAQGVVVRINAYADSEENFFVPNA